MQIENRNLDRFAVFEEDPTACREVGLSLAEAFHSIMAHCEYEPVWDVNGSKIRLRFRYLDEPFKGHFVGSLQGSPIDCFEAPSVGGNASREQIMRRVMSAGFRGWYAEPMVDFSRNWSAASAIEYQRSGEME